MQIYSTVHLSEPTYYKSNFIFAWSFKKRKTEFKDNYHFVFYILIFINNFYFPGLIINVDILEIHLYHLKLNFIKFHSDLCFLKKKKKVKLYINELINSDLQSHFAEVILVSQISHL